VIIAPASVRDGTAFNFTVIAEDQFNNTATGYAGTVTFSTNDPNPILSVVTSHMPTKRSIVPRRPSGKPFCGTSPLPNLAIHPCPMTYRRAYSNQGMVDLEICPVHVTTYAMDNGSSKYHNAIKESRPFSSESGRHSLIALFRVLDIMPSKSWPRR
jgi:hypothetical protein